MGLQETLTQNTALRAAALNMRTAQQADDNAMVLGSVLKSIALVQEAKEKKQKFELTKITMENDAAHKKQLHDIAFQTLELKKKHNEWLVEQEKAKVKGAADNLTKAQRDQLNDKFGENFGKAFTKDWLGRGNGSPYSVALGATVLSDPDIQTPAMAKRVEGLVELAKQTPAAVTLPTTRADIKNSLTNEPGPGELRAVDIDTLGGGAPEEGMSYYEWRPGADNMKMAFWTHLSKESGGHDDVRNSSIPHEVNGRMSYLNLLKGIEGGDARAQALVKAAAKYGKGAEAWEYVKEFTREHNAIKLWIADQITSDPHQDPDQFMENLALRRNQEDGYASLERQWGDHFRDVGSAGTGHGTDPRAATSSQVNASIPREGQVVESDGDKAPIVTPAIPPAPEATPKETSMAKFQRQEFETLAELPSSYIPAPFPEQERISHNPALQAPLKPEAYSTMGHIANAIPTSIKRVGEWFQDAGVINVRGGTTARKGGSNYEMLGMAMPKKLASMREYYLNVTSNNVGEFVREVASSTKAGNPYLDISGQANLLKKGNTIVTLRGLQGMMNGYADIYESTASQKVHPSRVGDFNSADALSGAMQMREGAEMVEILIKALEGGNRGAGGVLAEFDPDSNGVNRGRLILDEWANTGQIIEIMQSDNLLKSFHETFNQALRPADFSGVDDVYLHGMGDEARKDAFGPHGWIYTYYGQHMEFYSPNDFWSNESMMKKPETAVGPDPTGRLYREKSEQSEGGYNDYGYQVGRTGYPSPPPVQGDNSSTDTD